MQNRIKKNKVKCRTYKREKFIKLTETVDLEDYLW